MRASETDLSNRKIPTLAAFACLHAESRNVYPKNDLSYAEKCLNMMFSTSERKYPHDLAPASKVIFILNEIGTKTRVSHLAFEERAVFRLAKAEENLIRESG